MKIVKQSAELLWITPNAEQMIERAGRTCYKSEDKITPESSTQFIKNIIDRKHEAMLEHASASILFVTDRGVSHELVRHRLASYAQESTRYCNYGKEKFNNEISIILQPGLSFINQTILINSCKQNEDLYLELLKNQVSAQIARSVLPTCLKTEIVCTANMREWRTIFKLRLDKAAHPQMRELMKLAYDILVKEVPNVFADIRRD